MIVGEVAHQSHEDGDVGHLVQEILILQFVGFDVADSLLVGTSTVAILGHNRVLDHLTLLALQILHLVGNESSVDKVEEPVFDVALVQDGVTVGAQPAARDCGICVLVNEFVVQRGITADVEVAASTASRANHIWDDEDETWLDALLGFGRELLAVDHPEKVHFYLIGFHLEGLVKSEDVVSNEFGELQSGADVSMMRTDILREFPLFLLSQLSGTFPLLSGLHMLVVLEVLPFVETVWIVLVINLKLVSEHLISVLVLFSLPVTFDDLRCINFFG